MTGIKALLESRILPQMLIATQKIQLLQECIFYYVKYHLQRNCYRNRKRPELRWEHDM